jgi:hypothetical protein
MGVRRVLRLRTNASKCRTTGTSATNTRSTCILFGRPFNGKSTAIRGGDRDLTFDERAFLVEARSLADTTSSADLRVTHLAAGQWPADFGLRPSPELAAIVRANLDVVGRREVPRPGVGDGLALRSMQHEIRRRRLAKGVDDKTVRMDNEPAEVRLLVVVERFRAYSSSRSKISVSRSSVCGSRRRQAVI